MGQWEAVMSKSHRTHALAPFFLTLALATSCGAHEYRVGDMLIVHPWVAGTDATATQAAAFLTVKNLGGDPDRLVSVHLPNATGFRFASTETGDAADRFAKGLAVGPDVKMKLKPGTGFILLDIKGPLPENTMLSGTLTFERAGTVEVGFWVQEASSTSAVCAANPDGEPHD